MPLRIKPANSFLFPTASLPLPTFSIHRISTIDPNESRCVVPDQRFDYLCDLHKPGNKIPAYLHVTDIAGLIKGASEGAGLGNAFLSHIAAVDGIFHLIRGFENDEIMHVDDSVDPVRDLETITGELCKKDLDTIERAIENEKKEQKRIKVRRERGPICRTSNRGPLPPLIPALFLPLPSNIPSLLTPRFSFPPSLPPSP